MLKKIILGIFGVIALLVAVGFLYIFLEKNSYLSSSEERQFNRQLKEAIEQNRQEIPLVELTDFPWDEVCLYGSYSLGGSSNHDVVDGYKITGSIPDLGNDGALALLFKENQGMSAKFVEIRVAEESLYQRKKYCYGKNSKIILSKVTDTRSNEQYTTLDIGD